MDGNKTAQNMLEPEEVKERSATGRVPRTDRGGGRPKVYTCSKMNP